MPEAGAVTSSHWSQVKRVLCKSFATFWNRPPREITLRRRKLCIQHCNLSGWKGFKDFLVALHQWFADRLSPGLASEVIQSDRVLSPEAEYPFTPKWLAEILLNPRILVNLGDGDRSEPVLNQGRTTRNVRSRAVDSAGCKGRIAVVGWILAGGKSEIKVGGNAWVAGLFGWIGEVP